MYKIKDMRGSFYTANFIEDHGNKLFYAGFKVTNLIKQDRRCGSDLYYAVFGGKEGNIPLGIIALYEKDFKQAIAVIKS